MNQIFNVSIRQIHVSDVPTIVALSEQKRRAYEKVQPQFWKYAEHANECQSEWFRHLLETDDHIMLLAENDRVLGFIVGRLMKAPDVYDPGGLTLMIDDF